MALLHPFPLRPEYRQVGNGEGAGLPHHRLTWPNLAPVKFTGSKYDPKSRQSSRCTASSRPIRLVTTSPLARCSLYWRLTRRPYNGCWVPAVENLNFLPDMGRMTSDCRGSSQLAIRWLAKRRRARRRGPELDRVGQARRARS